MSDLNGTQMEKQPLLSRKNASFSRPLLASFLGNEQTTHVVFQYEVISNIAFLVL